LKQRLKFRLFFFFFLNVLQYKTLKCSFIIYPIGSAEAENRNKVICFRPNPRKRYHLIKKKLVNMFILKP